MFAPFVQVDYVRSVMAGDHLREEEHMALETLLANVPQSRTVKSNSLELTPSNTPQLSPATTPANKKNRLPIGTFLISALDKSSSVWKKDEFTYVYDATSCKPLIGAS